MKEISLFDRIMLVSDLVSQWLPVLVRTYVYMYAC